MNQISKSLTHLYSVFKVYLSLAVVAVLIALAHGVLGRYPLGLELSIFALIALLIARFFLVPSQSSLKFPMNTFIVLNLAFSYRRLYNSPPRSAQRLLALTVPKNIRENILSDLSFEYMHRAMESKFQADVWYWWQVIRSIAPIVRARLRVGLLRFFRVR